MNEILQLLQTNNPVFAGGVGLGLLALGAQGLRAGYSTGLILLKRHFLVTLEITSKDRAYPWVLQWLSMHSKKNQHISVETSFKPIKNIIDNTKTKSRNNHQSNSTNNNNNNDTNISTTTNHTNNNASITSSIFDFVPGPGQHFIWYKHMLINVQRFREQQMLDLNTGKPWEKIQFTAIGRDTKPFENILQEAFLLACLKEVGKTTIYTNWGSEWRPFGNPRQHRPLSSVILDENISDTILTDILEFKNSSNWYTDRGIPYRRGYLLHGPPGSGKSSFILALAGHLNYNICILNLAERGLTDDRLALALSCVPPQSIVLLEDIDAAFPSRITSSTQAAGAAAGSSIGLTQYNKSINSAIHSSSSGMHHHSQQNHSSSDVTFSGLLNVIDGVASSEERILFMTTNHIERLDPALIRPGRVDLTQCIGDASAYQIRCMFEKFYMQTYHNSNSDSSNSNNTGNNTTTTNRNNNNSSNSSSSRSNSMAADSESNKEMSNNVIPPFTINTDITASTSSSSSSLSSPWLLSLQEEFVRAIMSSGVSISMARLQGHFMCHKHSPSQAVATVYELLSSAQPSSSSSSSSSRQDQGQTNHQPPQVQDKKQQLLHAAQTNEENINAMTLNNNNNNNDDDDEMTMNDYNQAKRNSNHKGRGKRMLSVQEADKMIFNPQPGWDRDIKSI